jgi:hypothetical protein
VGQDSSPSMFDLNETDGTVALDCLPGEMDDEDVHKKDLIYSTLQYNELLANEHTYNVIENELVGHFDGASFQGSSDASYTDLASIHPTIDLPCTSRSVQPAQVHDSSTTSGSSNSYYEDNDFEPKIKPRKYRLKPEKEKKDPTYRAKRERNNDSVRQCRDKAKRLQLEKDERLAYLENEDIAAKRRIHQLEQRNEFLEKELIRMKRTCRCD